MFLNTYGGFLVFFLVFLHMWGGILRFLCWLLGVQSEAINTISYIGGLKKSSVLTSNIRSGKLSKKYSPTSFQLGPHKRLSSELKHQVCKAQP